MGSVEALQEQITDIKQLCDPNFNEDEKRLGEDNDNALDQAFNEKDINGEEEEEDEGGHEEGMNVEEKIEMVNKMKDKQEVVDGELEDLVKEVEKIKGIVDTKDHQYK